MLTVSYFGMEMTLILPQYLSRGKRLFSCDNFVPLKLSQIENPLCSITPCYYKAFNNVQPIRLFKHFKATSSE